MLLGTPFNNHTTESLELFIFQLMLQQRYAEVYELLVKQTPPTQSSLYNSAICLHWSGNYQEALRHLERIQLAPQLNNNRTTSSSEFSSIKSKQNQTDDYLNSITDTYIKNFPEFANDNLIRLKTACWLELGDYSKVIAIATPIAHKGYKNIIDALQLATTSNDTRI